MTIYDAGEEHDMAYMAMELLQGRDLRAHCTRGKLLPIKEVMCIMADVADALDYAHKNGVIHRDIKPANIMLLSDGTVKVTDFGIARIVEYSTTHTKMIQGTPSYMSPEQVNGEKVQGPSDLFSLGAVFYELLTGKKAFSGECVSSIMYSISKGEYVPLSKVAKKIPRRLESIAKKLLAKDVRRRYKRGADVAKDIRALMGE
jgi:serine/threonine-protein kinase